MLYFNGDSGFSTPGRALNNKRHIVYYCIQYRMRILGHILCPSL